MLNLLGHDSDGHQSSCNTNDQSIEDVLRIKNLLDHSRRILLMQKSLIHFSSLRPKQELQSRVLILRIRGLNVLRNVQIFSVVRMVMGCGLKRQSQGFNKV